MDNQPNRNCREEKNPGLRRDARDFARAEEKERGWKICESIDAARDCFGETTVKRKCAERHDERRQAQLRDERAVESAAERAREDRAESGRSGRESGVTPKF